MNEYLPVDTTQITAAEATQDKKHARRYWYSVLKENQKAMAKLKEKAKQRYELKKRISQAIKPVSAKDEVVAKRAQNHAS